MYGNDLYFTPYGVICRDILFSCSSQYIEKISFVKTGDTIYTNRCEFLYPFLHV